MAMPRVPKPRIPQAVKSTASRLDQGAAAHAPKIVSPWKLAKHDIQHQHKAVTWGPKGKPSAGCSGSICYRHPTVDFTVHRLTPAVYQNSPKGGRFQRTVDKAARHPQIGQMTAHDTRRAAKHLMETSPRWGQGNAPSRRSRSVVPLPKDRYISHRTMGVAAGAVAVGGGMYAYHHRQEIKAKAAGWADKHPHFAKSINYHSKGGIR